MATKDDRLEQVYAVLTSRKHIRSIQAVAAYHGFADLTALQPFANAIKCRRRPSAKCWSSSFAKTGQATRHNTR